MAERIGKFSFYGSFHDAAQDLPDADRLALYDAMCAYVFDGEEPRFEGVMRTIWKLVKPNLDSSVNGQRNGVKGGRGNASKPPCKPPVSGGANPPANPPFGKCETDKDKDMDRERDREADSDTPLKEYQNPADPSAGAAAAKAAPPKGGKARPFCPLCGAAMWKNTQTGRLHCSSCGDSFDKSKADWR